MPKGTASRASFRRSRINEALSPVACAEVDEHARSTLEPSARHITSMAFATSTL